MTCILIDSKWTRPGHVHRLRCSLTLGLRRVDFHSKVNTELATNGEDFCGICTLIHDFETVRQCMQECECRIAFLLRNFAHYASTRIQRRCNTTKSLPVTRCGDKLSTDC